MDVSSTTQSPAHKLELPPGGRQRCHYAWAHDDISALTASNLLKRYAEKYSGVLDYERPGLGSYGDAAFLNGAKGDPEPWPGPEPPYPLASLHEGLPGAKAAGAGGSAGLGGSPVVAGNLTEPLYTGNACGGPSAATEYAAGYGGGYLASGYCAQTSAALAPPPPPALLQPAPPPGPPRDFQSANRRAESFPLEDTDARRCLVRRQFGLTSTMAWEETGGLLSITHGLFASYKTR